MKDKHKEFCIESAITEYKNAMCFGIPNIGTMSSLISMLKNTEKMIQTQQGFLLRFFLDFNFSLNYIEYVVLLITRIY